MCYACFYLSLCIVSMADMKDACTTKDAAGRTDSLKDPNLQPDSSKDYGSAITDEKEVLNQFIPVLDETIKLGHPNGQTVNTNVIVFQWDFGDLARKVKKVELHGSSKDGIAPLFCERTCRIGSDCTKCKLNDLPPGKYDWHVEVVTHDGFKYMSGPGSFTIMPSALKIEIVPEFFHRDWALKPDTDNDIYATGAVVRFTWDLGKMAKKMKKIKFNAWKRNGPTVFSITHDCEKIDCKYGLKLQVVQDGKYDWMIVATGKDGSKHKSTIGHFQMLPAHLVKEQKKGHVDELDKLAEDIARNTFY